MADSQTEIRARYLALVENETFELSCQFVAFVLACCKQTGKRPIEFLEDMRLVVEAMEREWDTIMEVFDFDE